MSAPPLRRCDDTVSEERRGLLRTELSRLLRFGTVGAVNTLGTGAAFVVLSQVLPPPVAYTIVYAVGLGATTVVTARWVFDNDRLRLSRGVAFVVWYGCVYLLGLGIVASLDSRTDLSTIQIAVAIIGATAPLNYLGGRFIFTRPQPDD